MTSICPHVITIYLYENSTSWVFDGEINMWVLTRIYNQWQCLYLDIFSVFWWQVVFFGLVFEHVGTFGWISWYKWMCVVCEHCRKIWWLLWELGVLVLVRIFKRGVWNFFMICFNSFYCKDLVLLLRICVFGLLIFFYSFFFKACDTNIFFFAGFVNPMCVLGTRSWCVAFNKLTLWLRYLTSQLH